MQLVDLRRLQHYLRLSYPVQVVAIDDAFQGCFPDLPGCERTHTEPRRLYRELEAARHAWILERVAAGLPIPVPNGHRTGPDSPPAGGCQRQFSAT
jgi:hypothetical protein